MSMIIRFRIDIVIHGLSDFLWLTPNPGIPVDTGYLFQP